MEFRIKVQFFTPDRVPTGRARFIVDADTMQEAIIKQTEILSEWGYNQTEYVIHFIEVIK